MTTSDLLHQLKQQTAYDQARWLDEALRRWRA